MLAARLAEPRLQRLSQLAEGCLVRGLCGSLRGLVRGCGLAQCLLVRGLVRWTARSGYWRRRRRLRRPLGAGRAACGGVEGCRACGAARHALQVVALLLQLPRDVFELVALGLEPSYPARGGRGSLADLRHLLPRLVALCLCRCRARLRLFGRGDGLLGLRQPQTTRLCLPAAGLLRVRPLHEELVRLCRQQPLAHVRRGRDLVAVDLEEPVAHSQSRLVGCAAWAGRDELKRLLTLAEGEAEALAQRGYRDRQLKRHGRRRLLGRLIGRADRVDAPPARHLVPGRILALAVGHRPKAAKRVGPTVEGRPAALGL